MERTQGVKLRKECLITIGATASFDQLIEAAMSPDVFAVLKARGFTSINYQYGNSFSLFRSLEAAHKTSIEVNGFGFKKEGLTEDIRRLKRVDGLSEEGMAISHAGAGTILDVMRMGVPLIVVPNPTLLDDHQKELAEELARQGYATMGDVDNLAMAIEKACDLAYKAWGKQNAVNGVVQMMNTVIGADDMYGEWHEDGLPGADLRLSLD